MITKMKNKTAIYTEKYNTAIAESYYKDIRTLIRTYYKAVSNEAIDEFMQTGDFAQLTAEELLAKSGFVEMQLQPQIDKITNNFVISIEQQTNAELRKSFVEAGKTIPPQLTHTIYSKETKKLVSQQVQKIKGLLNFQYTKIDEALQNSIVENRSLTYFKQQLKEAGIYNEKRIKVIARNQLHYATNVVNINKALELDIEWGVWRHPPKSFYKTEGRKSHIEADGKKFKLKKGCKIDGEYIYPSQLPNCFPSDTIITHTNGIEGAFKRWYTGKLTQIITESGNIIKTTPNHPILISIGFVKANGINIGNYLINVVSVERTTSNQNCNNGDIKGVNISDTFNILATHSDANSVVVRDANFHGERVVDENVDIIFTDSSLKGYIEDGKLLFKRISDNKLSSTQQRSIIFRKNHSFICSFYKLIRRIFNSSQFGISYFSKFLTFFKRKFIHSDCSGNGLVSDSNIISLKKVCNSSSTDIMFFRQFKNGNIIHVICDDSIWQFNEFGFIGSHSDLITFNKSCSDSCWRTIINFCNGFTGMTIIIKLDKVIDIKEINDFSGHVFNLQTKNDIYIANNIISHNCKCYYQLII